MKKRRLIIGDYDTAEDGLFTLSACKITKGSQVQSFVSVPGRYAPIDTSTLLTDGQPYYGSAALDATLESSEGTRDERLARVSGMVNALDGRSMRIIHPDHPERYLVGRVQVRPEYNDPAHCAVRVSAVCEPWLYNAQETEVQANLPHAEIHKIGGVTRKTKNLFDPAPIGTKTFIGLTYTTEDGYVKINGTKINGANIHIMTAPNMTLPAGTYTVSVRMISGTVSGIEANGGVFFGINQNTYGQRTTPGVSKVGDVGVRTFALSEPTLVSSFDIAPDYASVGAVFDNAVFACQFEKADTATEYEPYFEGLRSAPVTEVESVGVNLIPYPYADTTKTQAGITFTDNGDGSVTMSGTATANATFTYATSLILKHGQAYFLSTDVILAYKDANGNTKYESGDFVWDDSYTFVRIYSQVANGVSASKTVYPAVNKGTEALPYRPYRRHTLPIPEAVQALDGYGCSVSDTLYNYIDLDAKKFVKRVGKVDMGTLGWQYDGAIMFVENCFNSSTKAKWVNKSTKFNCISDFGDGVAFDNVYGTTRGFCTSADGLWLHCAKPGDTDAATFKAAMSGVMLYYELATPVVTDISDLLSGANTIPAEEGGTLTMVNPYSYEVPQEVTYYLDGESPQQVELANAGRLAVVPVVTVKGEVTLSYGNITQTLSTGTYTLPWLYLTPDKGPLLPASHIVTCSGGGSVTFTYREAVLAE